MIDNKTQKLFYKLINLQNQKYELLKIEVENIINNKITDDSTIQNTLDCLFDMLENKDALLLYRKLCKYYSSINTDATIDYINYYRKEYDPNGLNFGNVKS